MPAHTNLRTVRFFMDYSFSDIVFRTKYFCELCGRYRNLNVYGNPFFIRDRDSEYEKQVLKWARFNHWIDSHRVCAICGKLVKSGELESVINKGIRIHKNYTLEYRRVKEGDEFGNLLIVHKSCIKRRK